MTRHWTDAHQGQQELIGLFHELGFDDRAEKLDHCRRFVGKKEVCGFPRFSCGDPACYFCNRDRYKAKLIRFLLAAYRNWPFFEVTITPFRSLSKQASANHACVIEVFKAQEAFVREHFEHCMFFAEEGIGNDGRRWPHYHGIVAGALSLRILKHKAKAYGLDVWVRKTAKQKFVACDEISDAPRLGYICKCQGKSILEHENKATLFSGLKQWNRFPQKGIQRMITRGCFRSSGAQKLEAEVGSLFQLNKSLNGIRGIGNQSIWLNCTAVQLLLDSGMNLKQALGKMKIAPSTYHAWPEKYRVSPRNHSPEEQESMFQRIMISNKPISEACKEFGVTRNQFYYWRKKHNMGCVESPAPSKEMTCKRQSSQQVDHQEPSYRGKTRSMPVAGKGTREDHDQKITSHHRLFTAHHRFNNPNLDPLSHVYQRWMNIQGMKVLEFATGTQLPRQTAIIPKRLRIRKRSMRSQGCSADDDHW